MKILKGDVPGTVSHSVTLLLCYYYYHEISSGFFSLNIQELQAFLVRSGNIAERHLDAFSGSGLVSV